MRDKLLREHNVQMPSRDKRFCRGKGANAIWAPDVCPPPAIWALALCALQVGTLAYMAPEVIQTTGNYDGKLADIWSCGVMLYVMLFGQYPFESPAQVILSQLYVRVPFVTTIRVLLDMRRCKAVMQQTCG